MAYDDLNDKEKIELLHLRLATIEEFLCSLYPGFHDDILWRVEAKTGSAKIIDEMKNLRKDYRKSRAER
jgi:hypothetical protein